MSAEKRVHKKEVMEVRRERRRSKTWGMYSSGSSRKILMYQGVFSKVSMFFIDIVGGAEQGDGEYEGSIAEGRDPDHVHPGGYS